MSSPSLFFVFVKDPAHVGADRETRRHRQAGVGHFRQPGALAAERVLHVAFSFRLAAAKKINVFLHYLFSYSAAG